MEEGLLYPTERRRKEHGMSSITPVPVAFRESTGPDSVFLSNRREATLPFSPMTSTGESKNRRFNFLRGLASSLLPFGFR